MVDIYSSGLESFVDHVIPLRQRQGIFRTQYDGETLRSHYGLEEPANPYSAAAPFTAAGRADR